MIIRWGITMDLIVTLMVKRRVGIIPNASYLFPFMEEEEEEREREEDKGKLYDMLNHVM